MDGLDENALQREDGPSSAALEMFKYQFNLKWQSFSNSKSKWNLILTPHPPS